jgi:hypothetical protein
VLGQYPKQPVPPDLEPASILTLQQIMQLAGVAVVPDARSTPPAALVPAQVGNPIALVVSLTVYPQEQASPDDGQPLDLPLREDLPGRLFTMETP